MAQIINTTLVKSLKFRMTEKRRQAEARAHKALIVAAIDAANDISPVEGLRAAQRFLNHSGRPIVAAPASVAEGRRRAKASSFVAIGMPVAEK